MNKNLTEESTLKVLKDGVVIGYLTSKDEENGEDIELDLKGYSIIAIDDTETM